jgi:predicted HD superfamily hydrolase involved in NAD metabolism
MRAIEHDRSHPYPWTRALSIVNILDVEAYLRNHLTAKRFEHSIGVMNTMEELAQLYSLDKRQAIAAGLLHDIAKELPADQWAAIASRDPLLSLDVQRYNYDHYLHGPVGAMMVKREFGMRDQEVLGAIATHGYYGPW